jgi:hypothetical protein
MLLSKRWFHGDLSTRDAEVRLVGKGVGAFLVRFSTFAAGTFTLSRVGTLSLLCSLFSALLPLLSVCFLSSANCY